MNKKLTMLQSFNVMYEFLDMYFLQNRSGDLATILGGMSFLSKNTTADPAMWVMWRRSIDTIAGRKTDKHFLISVKQAFEAIMLFLDDYFGPQSYGDIEDLVQDIKLEINNKTTNSIIWKNWLKAVEITLSLGDYKNNLILFKD